MSTVCLFIPLTDTGGGVSLPPTSAPSTSHPNDIKQVYIDLKTDSPKPTPKSNKPPGVKKLDNNILITVVVSLILLFPLVGVFIFVIKK